MNPLEAIGGAILSGLGNALAFFYDFIPNYGVSIILLTLLLNLLLFPLTLKQTRSMRAMQEVQPELKRLQKEYKHDREELNRQMMALYQERGINPAAGCLPMIVQLPIWFLLFRILSVSVDAETGERVFHGSIPGDSGLADALRAGNANFLGMDLLINPGDALAISIATAVPYIILIAIVIVTGFYQTNQMMRRQRERREQSGQQQEANPQTESINKAMRFMPLLIGVFSWRFPGGLVLYFAASNLFRVGQQAFILRDEGKEIAEKSANGPKAALAEDIDGDVSEETSERPKPKSSEKAASKGTTSDKGKPTPNGKGKPSGGKKSTSGGHPKSTQRPGKSRGGKSQGGKSQGGKSQGGRSQGGKPGARGKQSPKGTPGGAASEGPQLRPPKKRKRKRK